MRSRNGVVWGVLVVLASAGTGLGSLSDGLVAYYPFNGNANDASGNGNNGVLMGNAAVGGGILSLDGDGDYVHVQDSTSLHLSTAGTITALINIAPTADLSHDKPVGIVNKTNGSTFPSQVEFDMVYNSYYKCLEGIICDDSTSDYVQYWGHDPRDGTWYHLAMTWGNGSISLYLDGTPVQTKSMTTIGVTVKGFDMSIGRHYHDIPGGWYYLPGMIDEVRIYNRALSEGEIGALAVIPAPGAVVLAGLGVSVVGWLRRRRVV